MVLRNVVHEGEAELGVSVPLLSGQAEPLCSLLVVLGYAIAREVHAREMNLCVGIALLGELLPVRSKERGLPPVHGSGADPGAEVRPPH